MDATIQVRDGAVLGCVECGGTSFGVLVRDGFKCSETGHPEFIFRCAAGPCGWEVCGGCAMAIVDRTGVELLTARAAASPAGVVALASDPTRGGSS